MIARCLTILAIGPVVMGCLSDGAGQSSANYQITRSVISTGGGRSTSASYSLTGTFGQPWPVHASESESYNLGSGFWGATVKLFTVAIQSVTYSIAEGVRITWHSIADATYTLYFTESLSAPWQLVKELPATGGLMQWFDDGTDAGTPPTAAGVLKRFYRLSGQP